MGRRYKVSGRPNYLVQRDKKGRFKKWTEIMPSGVRADEARKAEKKLPRSKPGYGHRADYLPPRGTGLKKGTAGERRGGNPRSDVKRAKRHKKMSQSVQQRIQAQLDKAELSKHGYRMWAKTRSRCIALGKAVAEDGGLTVFRRLNLLMVWNKNDDPDLAKIARRDRDWVKKKYYDTPKWTVG